MYLLPSAYYLIEKFSCDNQSIRYFLDPVLRSCPFSEDDYLDMYPDVAETVSKFELTPRQHYVNNGYWENRFPFKVTIDEIWYLNKYSDIKETDINDILAHFISSGYKEGRMPFLPEFDRDYIDKVYPDWQSMAKNLNIEIDVQAYYIEYGYAHLMIPYNIFK